MPSHYIFKYRRPFNALDSCIGALCPPCRNPGKMYIPGNPSHQATGVTSNRCQTVWEAPFSQNEAHCHRCSTFLKRLNRAVSQTNRGADGPRTERRRGCPRRSAKTGGKSPIRLSRLLETDGGKLRCAGDAGSSRRKEKEKAANLPKPMP